VHQQHARFECAQRRGAQQGVGGDGVQSHA
jgi:hypothetical protein